MCGQVRAAPETGVLGTELALAVTQTINVACLLLEGGEKKIFSASHESIDTSVKEPLFSSNKHQTGSEDFIVMMKLLVVVVMVMITIMTKQEVRAVRRHLTLSLHVSSESRLQT